MTPVPPPVDQPFGPALATTPPIDECYRWDDRIADSAVGASTTSSGFDYLSLLAFQAPHGGETVTSLSCQLFGGYSTNSYSAGSMEWCIYEDPTDDFNPSDAVLLWTSTDTSAPNSTNNGVFQSIAVPDITVTGTWWVAVHIPNVAPGEFPMGLSTEVPSFGRAWECTASPGTINLNSLTANGYFDDIANGCCDGVWHIRAEGTSCIDTADCYALDSGVVDHAFGFECGLTGSSFDLDWMMMNQYEAEGGADLIRELSAQFGHPALGSAGYDPQAPIRWAIWDDPTDDGNPSDLNLLWSAGDTVGADLDSGGFKTIAVPEVPVTGTFFVGVVFEDNTNFGGGTPMCLDTTAPSYDRSWIGYQLGGNCGDPIDAADLTTINNLHRTTTPTAFWADEGNWMIRAHGWNCECGDATTYCTAAPNSVSPDGARIAAGGSVSITANSLTLTVTDCPPMAMGLFICGDDKLNHPLSNGFLCIFGTPIHRLATVQADAAGEISLPLDQQNLVPGLSIAPGDTWNFQLWYRDTVGAGANLSDAIAVTFCP